MNLVFTAGDWLTLFLHFTSLSLLAVGGAIITAPDMHRFLVNEQGWLGEAQFTSSLALAQASPGPNAMYIALIGWHVGLNAAGGQIGLASMGSALLGLMIAMAGTLLPSCTLTYLVAQWGHRNRELRSVRAFKAGMAPMVVALLLATGWLVSSTQRDPARDWPLWLLTAVSLLLVWKTRLHLLWLIGAGALLGALGLLG
jgi:chromate transporter